MRRLPDADMLLAGLAVLLSPMNYLRLPGIYLTASDIAIALALLVMIRKGRLPRQPFGIATPLWYGGFVLMMAGLVLGSVAHGNPSDLANITAQYGYSLIVMPLVLAGRPTEQVITLLRMLVLGIVAVMVFGIAMIHAYADPPRPFVTWNGRMASLVERVNECAALGAMAIVLVLGLWQIGRVRTIEMIVALPVLGYGIMLTGSNTGLICAALGVGMMAVVNGSGRMIAMVIGVLAASVAFVALFPDQVPPVFRDRVLSGLETGDIERAGTFTGRMELIREAFSLSGQHLLIGMGADEYRDVSLHGAPVHNSYLLMLNEGGLLSLLGLAILMATGLPSVVSHLTEARFGPHLTVAVTILLIFALMLNTFPHFYARFWTVPLILVFALTASLPAPYRNPVLRHV